MARRNFINAEMIALSAALIDAKRHRPAFLATPLMAGLLPEVESAHADLLGLSNEASSDEASQELGELQAREKATDRVHDSKGGGVQVVLQGAIALAETDDEAAVYERVKARLFPEEGAIFRASYAAESGNAERVAKELENVETRTTLAGIKVRKGVTLLDETRAWVKAGLALGVDESRKVVLEGLLAANSNAEVEGNTRVDNASARNGWIRAINAVHTTAALLKGKHAETFAPVLREMRAAEAKVDERAMRRRSAAEDDSDETDAVKGTAAPAGSVQKAVNG